MKGRYEMTVIKKKLFPFFIIMLFTLSALPDLAIAASPFKDVKTNHWAYSAIDWAYNEGIISGFPDGRFAPESTITEAQFVTMLIRFDCSSATSFAASPGEHKASGNYRYLQRKNIPLNGYASISRREMPIKKGLVAQVAAAFRGVDLSETRAVQYMYLKDLANGATGKNDFKDYGATLSMTRAEAAVFFQRLSKHGNCNLSGLSKKPTGSDDSKYSLPPDFLGSGGVTFVPPEVKPLPPSYVSLTEFDIERSTLIANGYDSTFVSLSLKTCSGNPISYEDSLSFQVTSKQGAMIDNGKFGAPVIVPNKYLDAALKAEVTAREKAKQAWIIANEAQDRAANQRINYVLVDGTEYVVSPDWFITYNGNLVKVKPEETSTRNASGGEEEEVLARLADSAVLAAEAADAQLEIALENLAKIRAEISANPVIPAARQSTSTFANTDGPDLAVEVTAPKVTASQTDTLSFKFTGNNQNDMGCYQNPVTVHLNYVPQAELRIELGHSFEVLSDGTQQAVTIVLAKILRPGGEVNEDFNGRVRFHSAQGTSMSNEYANFVNGIARTTLTTPWYGQGILNEVSVEIVQVDPLYQNEIAHVLNKTHSKDVFFEPDLQVNNSCTFTNPQVAFIIDSSGSMKQSDKDGLRIKKSEDFIMALNAKENFATHFNSKGHFIIGPDLPLPVKNTFNTIGASGGTNIADGLKKAFDKLDKSPGSSPKIAILLTDGKSNESQVLKMIEEAKRDSIKVYTIGLGKKDQLNEALLQKLATQTGGQYYHVAENIDLGAAYQSILSEITCGVPASTCTFSSQAFISPTLETRGSEFFMNTYVTEGCGEIARVVLRFKSYQGDIDYELAYRGQSYFALKKGIYEISNFNLLEEGIFLAYDTKGKLVAERSVKMRN